MKHHKNHRNRGCKKCRKYCQCDENNVKTIRVTDLSPFRCPNTPGSVIKNTEIGPSIAVGYNPINEDKPMVVVCYQQDIFVLFGASNANYMKISFDGGATFEDPIALPDVICYGGSYERSSDPHVSITSNGDILFAGYPYNIESNFNTAISIAKYDVREKIFLYTLIVDPQPGNGTGPNDPIPQYPALIVDPQDCSGNTAYLGWTRYWYQNIDAGYITSELTFSKTTDDSEWSTPIDYAQTPLLDISLGYNPDPSGYDAGIAYNVFVLLENHCECYSKIVSLFCDLVGVNYVATNQYNLLYSCYSIDQGKTWSLPLLFNITFNGGSGVTATQIVDPDNYGVFIRGGDGVPCGASDRKRNRIFAAAGLDSLLNVPNPSPSGIYLFVSLDGAKTWKTIGKINQYQSVQAFNPSITVLKNGNVAVSYYDFRNHKSNPDTTLPLETDRWMDIFHYDECNNTVSLVCETRLTKKSFNLRNAPLSGSLSFPGYFLGDYMGIDNYKCKIYDDYGVANADENNKTDIYLSTVKL